MRQTNYCYGIEHEPPVTSININNIDDRTFYKINRPSVYIFRDREARDKWAIENPLRKELNSRRVHHLMFMPRALVRTKIHQAKEDMASKNLGFIELTNTEDAK